MDAWRDMVIIHGIVGYVEKQAVVSTDGDIESYRIRMVLCGWMDSSWNTHMYVHCTTLSTKLEERHTV